jgi:hypothetical protein
MKKRQIHKELVGSFRMQMYSSLRQTAPRWQEQRGSALSAIQLLARRLSANLHGRTVVLAWTKSDIAIADTMRQAVLDAASSQIPGFREISVSMQAPSGQDTGVGVGLTDLLQLLLDTRRLERPSPLRVKKG